MTSLLPFLFSFVRKAANTVPHDIGDPGNTSASLVIDWCTHDLLATLFSFLDEAVDWFWSGGQSQVQ